MIDIDNIYALIITFLIALIWLRINDFAANRGWISSYISRKIIHIGTGPIFIICWLMFNNSIWARFLAALVPLMITVQFFLVGSGIIKDEASVKAMSRSGKREEILQGPLYYGIIFIIVTMIYWHDTPIGIIALLMLCGGDGLADIFGRRFGITKIPWNKQKTCLGSVSMFLGGFLLVSIVLIIFKKAGHFSNPITFYIPRILIICLISTLVESLPLNNVDNITVTLSSILMGHILI